MNCSSEKKGNCRKCPLGAEAGQTVLLTKDIKLPTKYVHITEIKPNGRIGYIGFTDHGCFVGWADRGEYKKISQQKFSYLP